jgi:hypothetical protein
MSYDGGVVFSEVSLMVGLLHLLQDGIAATVALPSRYNTRQYDNSQTRM